MNKKVRMFISLLMLILMPFLMVYSLIGEELHEILGIIIFVLFLLHHIINRAYYKAIFKGKYNFKRIIILIINIAALMFMIIQPLSGIIISKHLFSFIKIKGVSALARSIHLQWAYLGLIILSIHSGMHMKIIINRFSESKSLKKVFAGVWILCAGAGINAFIKRNFIDYIFIKTAFVYIDFDENVCAVIFDYCMVMMLFMLVGFTCISIPDKKTANITEK